MRFVNCVVISCCAFLVLCLSAPVGSADAGPDVIRVNARQFQIPVEIQRGQRPNIKELQLYVSADQGKTWQQAASVRSDAKAFSFEAPREGTYWFNVRVIKADGTADPVALSWQRPALKLQVSAGESKRDKGTQESVQDLILELKAVRQQLEGIEKRLSEIGKAKQK